MLAETGPRNAGDTVEFYASGFRNPISTDQVTGYVISSMEKYDGEYYEVDVSDDTSSILQVSTLASIDQATFSPIDPDCVIVSSTCDMELIFESPVPINADVTYTVTLPDPYITDDVIQVMT